MYSSSPSPPPSPPVSSSPALEVSPSPFAPSEPPLSPEHAAKVSAIAAVAASARNFLGFLMCISVDLGCNCHAALVRRLDSGLKTCRSSLLAPTKRVGEHRNDNDDAEHHVLPFGLDRHDPQAVDQ